MLLRSALLLPTALLGAVAASALVALADVQVLEPAWRVRVVAVATVVAGLVGGTVALLARRSRSVAADVGAVAAGVLLAGLGAAALHGTRWGWFGLYADSSFRTQMATRYADHLALVDYGYRGLPAYYPPALGWLEGRLGALTGLAGWEAVRPVQVLVAAVVPVLAYLLWRQVVPPLPAAAVAGLATVWTAHPQKPDEWLVLVCLVPWWLLAVRDVRAPGVDRWPAWRLGVVLGLLLLTHTYYFLPMGVATLLAVGYDAVRRRRPARLPWRRALAIGAVGLLVAAPSWVGIVLARLRLPSDALQMRYAYPWSNLPPFPLPVDAVGVAGLVGLGWLLATGWRRRQGRGADELAGALALALLGCCVVLGLGAVGVRVDVGLLAFKTKDLVTALLLVCAVVAGWRWLAARQDRWQARGRQPGRGPRWAGAAAPVVVAVAAASAGHHVASVWATGPPALVAQTTRYPDGSFPHGGPGQEPYYPTLFVDPDDPSVEQVREAWRSLSDVPLDEAVVVTSQVDLLATTPVYGFLAYKSIYSHPNGRFAGRVELLEQVAACPTSSCAARLLRDNPYDAVDGLVLRRDGDRLVLPFMVDDFPDGTRLARVDFPAAVLSGEEFVSRDLGRLVVVVLREES